MLKVGTRAAETVRRGRAKAGWLGALAVTGLMALPTITAPLAQATPLLAPTLFQAPVGYWSQYDMVGVAHGDLNGDGIPDLVIGNEYSNNIQVRLGNGDGTFGPTAAYSYAEDSWYLVEPVLADFNGDGFLDIAVTSDEYDKVFIFLNNGHGVFRADTTITGVAAGGETWGIAAADVNGDGAMDVIFTEYGEGQVDVALGVGNGAFHAPRAYATGASPVAVAVGDFNGDGRPDLAVSNYGGTTASILINTGSGYFHPQSSLSVGSTPYGVVTGDFNNDGKTDLAVASEGTGLSVFRGNGNGTFQSAHLYAPIFACSGDYALASGDFNGDGKTDLAVTDKCSDGYLDVWSGDGAGTFSFAKTFNVGSDNYDMTAADFNNDGKTDLMITDYTTGYLEALLTALPPTVTLTAGSPSKIRSGVLYATANTLVTLTMSPVGDGAKTVAWRLYASHTTAPSFSTLNSTSKNVSLHGLANGYYYIQYYGVSDHGLTGAVQTTLILVGSSVS